MMITIVLIGGNVVPAIQLAPYFLGRVKVVFRYNDGWSKET
jgi:hypothetical protein